MRTLIFDTETTGLVNFKSTDPRKQPHLVQLGAMLVDDGVTRAELNLIVDPGVPIPTEASDIHGITTPIAQRFGTTTLVAISMFNNLLKLSDRIAGHNLDFDIVVMATAYFRVKRPLTEFAPLPRACTMQSLTDVLKLPKKNNYYPGYKWPSLLEAHEYFFQTGFEDAHDAMADVRATARILAEIESKGIEVIGGTK